MDPQQLQPFIGIQDPRIPFIRFEQRAVERRTAAGTIEYVDTDFAMITAQGSKDTTEKKVEQWFPQIKQAARDGMYPPGWIPRFEEMYRLWKETREDPVDGTPVKNWPAISAAECKILLHAGVRSIEDLANANEEFLGRIGMGARRLKQLAVDWLSANKDQGPLVAEMDSMRQQIGILRGEVAKLRADNVALKLQSGSYGPIKQMSPQDYLKQVPPVEERLEALRQNNSSDEGDLIEDTLASELNG